MAAPPVLVYYVCMYVHMYVCIYLLFVADAVACTVGAGAILTMFYGFGSI